MRLTRFGHARFVRRQQTSERGRGQSLVEFAFCAPLLLVLLLGTLDLGQMFFQYVQLRNAVREGASYGARNPLDNAGIRSVVRNHAGSSSKGSKLTTLTDSKIPISLNNCCSTGQNGTITVSSSLDFKPIVTGFFAGILPRTITLSSSSTARVMT